MSHYLATRSSLSQEIVQAFADPLSFQHPSSEITAIVPLVVELLDPQVLHHSYSNSVRFDQHQQLVHGLATAIQWLYESSEWHKHTCFSMLTLHSLLPIYLTSTRDSWEKSLGLSLHLLRKTACLSHWCKALEDHCIFDWLHHQERLLIHPQISMERSFRLSLQKMNHAFWEWYDKGFSVRALNATATEDSVRDSAYWSIALQLSRGETKPTLPPNLKIGDVSWEKILRHWEKLNDALSKTVSRQPSPVPDLSNAMQVKGATPQTTTNHPVSSPRCNSDDRLVEIQCYEDPELTDSLETFLQQVRQEQSSLSLVVVKRLNRPTDSDTPNTTIKNWQSRFLDCLISESDTRELKGFTTDGGELLLVYCDIDRTDLSFWIRESFAKINASSESWSMTQPDIEPLVAGIAMANGPSRSFRINQLIDGARRCMEGAEIQGIHAVKTIQVY
ncbi:MAG: hypothetical protein KGQ60_02570 [Planctomycetes bacterium]|nr:hypothetical protein [Planctomycetota bacterium]